MSPSQVSSPGTIPAMSSAKRPQRRDVHPKGRSVSEGPAGRENLSREECRRKADGSAVTDMGGTQVKRFAPAGEIFPASRLNGPARDLRDQGHARDGDGRDERQRDGDRRLFPPRLSPLKWWLCFTRSRSYRGLVSCVAGATGKCLTFHIRMARSGNVADLGTAETSGVTAISIRAPVRSGCTCPKHARRHGQTVASIQAC
jgi:hypothetical protein